MTSAFEHPAVSRVRLTPDQTRRIEGLIPHRQPMLAVDELIGLSEDEAVSRTVIRPDSFFLDDRGRVEETLLFEMVAQTFAALAACRASPGSIDQGSAPPMALGPEAGFLVAVKKMDFHGRPEVGTAVEITANVLSRVDDFAVVAGRAVQTGRLLAEGQMTILVPGSSSAWSDSTGGGHTVGGSAGGGTEEP